VCGPDFSKLAMRTVHLITGYNVGSKGDLFAAVPTA